MVMGKMKMKMKVKDEDEDDSFYPHFDLSKMHPTVINESNAAARMAARPRPRSSQCTNIAHMAPLPREWRRYRGDCTVFGHPDQSPTQNTARARFP